MIIIHPGVPPIICQCGCIKREWLEKGTVILGPADRQY